MSIIHRDRKAPPDETSTNRQAVAVKPKPYKHLVIIAGILVLLAIVAGAAIMINRDDAPATNPPASAGPSKAASPALSERDKAAAAAEDAYKAYWKATDRVSAEGGAEKLPADLASVVTGPQRKADLQAIQGWKRDGVKTTGASVVNEIQVQSLGDLGDKTPEAKLTACVDLSGRPVTQNGKPLKTAPQYLQETVTLHRESGDWKIYTDENKVLPEGQTCTT